MKSLKSIIQNKLLFTLLFATAIFTAYGQKLPSAQKNGVRAPANIKIDGKATEWDNKFQAYSNHTQFYYTISNDDNNLYLTIHATESAIINRIFKGGVTLTINNSAAKKDKDGIHITYPLINGFFIPLENLGDRFAKRKSSINEGDSLMRVANKNMYNKVKEIKVIGINNIDTLISIYNTDGIKAASALNNKMEYTYELSVPLKNLGLSVNDSPKFSYQLMINQVGLPSTFLTSSGLLVTISSPKPTFGQDATDFWGEYTLAK
jgi:hypothetical protein